MNEQPIVSDGINYTDRYEYDPTRSESLRGLAFEAIDDIIMRQSSESRISYEAESRTVRHEVSASLYGEGDEFDSILLSDFSNVELLRAPSVTRLEVISEEYAQGPLRRMARVSLKEYIVICKEPLITEYYLELYAGGATHATIATSDVFAKSGLDERHMNPYDFRHFASAIEMIASVNDALANETTLRKRG